MCSFHTFLNHVWTKSDDSLCSNRSFDISILNILGITPLLKYFYSSPWLGFLHGIILTSLTVFITMFLLVSNGIGELKIKDETIVSFIKVYFSSSSKHFALKQLSFTRKSIAL